MKPATCKTQSRIQSATAFWSLTVLVSMLSISAQARDAKLGTPQKAGPFQVALTTNPSTPQAGVNRFRADVTQDGKPVKDAEVTLRLTMPLHRHGGRSGHEPKLETQLFASGDGYARTVRLSMGGVWQADVRVKAGDQKGTATYRFTVGKATPKHLGMQHPAEPFEVVLTTTPEAPVVGDNTFQVKVTRDGKPVTDATVNLTLALPMMRMPKKKVDFALKPIPRERQLPDTGNPHAGMSDRNIYLTLQPKPDGVYEGAANLPLDGDWEARINIQSGGEWATAFYQFKVAAAAKEKTDER